MSIPADALAAIATASAAFGESFSKLGPNQESVAAAQAARDEADARLVVAQNVLDDSVTEIRGRRAALDAALDAAGLTPLDPVTATPPAA